MNRLSITIITLNEEANIERCLQSVCWADEILILDSGSTDQTLSICRKYGCRIMKTEWLGFGPTKKLAVDSASYDWILSVDADEVVTEELKALILEILKNPQAGGYRIKRNSFYLNNQIRHCGWHRDYPIRLFHRQSGNFNDKIVHEGVRVNGKVIKTEAPLLHYTYPTVESHIARMNQYSTLGAQQDRLKAKSVSLPGAVLRGWIKFFKMYLFQKGFLDGKAGFILCYNSAFGIYLKYLKLWAQNR